MRAVASRVGPVGLVHFDTHTPTPAARSSRWSGRTGHDSGSSSRVTSTRSGTSRSASAAAGPVRTSSAGRPSAGSRRSSCTTSALGIDPVVERALGGRRRPGLPQRRHRRARPRVRARDGHARAGRDDCRRPAACLPRDRRSGEPRRRRRRRGVADRDRLGRRDRARRRAGRARGPRPGSPSVAATSRFAQASPAARPRASRGSAAAGRGGRRRWPRRAAPRRPGAPPRSRSDGRGRRRPSPSPAGSG